MGNEFGSLLGLAVVIWVICVGLAYCEREDWKQRHANCEVDFK